jgi:PPE-repeat protein
MSASTGAGAKKKAPEPDSAAAAAASSAQQAARRQRRRRARQRDYGDEYMDMNVDVEPDWDETVASDRGAGSLGFTGTARTKATATGLTTLAGDEFGSGPTIPMMPATWDSGRD